MILRSLLLLCALLPVSFAAAALDLTGAGASAPYPLYAKWAARYHQLTGHRVNYQSIGSGGGQQQIIAKTVDFGASDDPLSLEKLQKNHLMQFPAVIGGTVPIVNIKGVHPGELRLTGELLAEIFLGRIKRWDDPAIVALNPDLALPARGIVVVHRADGSGTTFGWTHYLSQVSQRWRESVGFGKAVRWPTGQGGKGNEGVAAYARQLSGSIAYIEYAFARQNQLSWVQLQNRAGNFVNPGQASFAAAAANADWGSAPGMGLVLNNQPGADSWPITAASYILLPLSADYAARRQQVQAFFDWAWRDAAELASNLFYVPLPREVSDQIRRNWAIQEHRRELP